nr:zinc finger, CCHC-type [Tanacetum cinerariifolium]
ISVSSTIRVDKELERQSSPIRIILSIEDKLNYLEHPIPPALVAPAGQHVAPEILAAHNDWIKGSKEIAGLMLMTMEPEIQQNLEPLHAYKMLKELKTLFAQQAEQELLQTTRDFHSCRQEEGQSVSSYVLKMKGYIDDLERLGHPVTLGLGGLRASRKLKPGALSLYVGNDQRKAVEAIGAFYLCLPSGLEIVLNNCHYAPNNMVYFSAILRDGIFEIDLSNSLTNESSVYAVSNKRAKLDLDSALLAFEKCVSCMSGKMARKPYTHQVERAKDILRLIHTDVCGPIKIMSRQGASYFVTFTGDFSRYGYEYLLKHKHEVFETFKVFQKEVEIQLDRICLYIDDEEHELRDLGKTANYLESGKWLNAINVEMQSMKDNKVWVLVELPPNGKTFGSKWLFKKKTDMDGNSVKTYLAKCFSMKDLGKAAYILGIKIYRVRSKQLIGLCQSDCNEKILKRYFMENSKRGSIPMQEKLKLSKSQGASTPAEMKRMRNVPYASAVGSIIYATRYVFVLNGGAVDWKSANQSIFATSSAEAEYIVAFDASKKAIWVRKFISGLGVDKLNYLEQPIPPAPVAHAGQHVAPEILAAHNAWIKGSKKIAGLMLMTMEPEIQRNLEPLHAHEMLKELKTLFAHMGKTINKLHAMLKLHEQSLPKSNTPALNAIRDGKVQKGNKHKKSHSQTTARGHNHGKGKNKQAYAPKPKIPPPPKRENPAKDSICHEYREIGQWKRNCL